MWEIFKIKTTPYNLRMGKLTKLPKTKTKCYGINAFIFRGSILWNSGPNEIKKKESTQSFKRSIKTWNAKLCNCKTVVHDIYICKYIYERIFYFLFNY